jgi:TrmH RNA methyltransferase
VRRNKRDPAAAPPRNETHEVVQGLRAGLAVVARRPKDVARVAYAAAVRTEVLREVRGALARDVACVETDERELNRLADSTHHEGLCVLARPRRWTSAQDLAEAVARSRGRAIALDRIRNPYNVGAILRSAAFFGLDGVVLGAPAPHSGLAPTAVRVAEGGAEEVAIARTTDLADTLSRLRARGVRVVGADSHAPTSAMGFAHAGATVLVLGNEREGLADRVRAQCDALVAIRGAGRVESLNVGVAAGILIAELTRP